MLSAVTRWLYLTGLWFPTDGPLIKKIAYSSYIVFGFVIRISTGVFLVTAIFNTDEPVLCSTYECFLLLLCVSDSAKYVHVFLTRRQIAALSSKIKSFEPRNFEENQMCNDWELMFK